MDDELRFEWTHSSHTNIGSECCNCRHWGKSAVWQRVQWHWCEPSTGPAVSVPAASFVPGVFSSKFTGLLVSTWWTWETFYFLQKFFFASCWTTLMNKDTTKSWFSDTSESFIFPSVLLSDCFPQDYITCQLPFLGITTPCPAGVLTRRPFAQHQALQPGSECLGEGIHEMFIRELVFWV